jgi:hypothetical protein
VPGAVRTRRSFPLEPSLAAAFTRPRALLADANQDGHIADSRLLSGAELCGSGWSRWEFGSEVGAHLLAFKEERVAIAVDIDSYEVQSEPETA